MPSMSARKKYNIWKKTNGICSHCGKKMYGKKTIEHILPRSKGGGADTRNLIPLCEKCNKLRSSEEINPREFYSYLDKKYLDEYYDYIKEDDKKSIIFFNNYSII